MSAPVRSERLISPDLEEGGADEGDGADEAGGEEENPEEVDAPVSPQDVS